MAGVINAQAFNANAGGNAGTSAWAAGGGLPQCGSQPCVPTNSFFVQAPSSIGMTPFGWTLPNTQTSANQLVYAGPTATDSGGKQAAPVGYVPSDSTVSHALFATSGVPGFRAISANDLPIGCTSGCQFLVGMENMVPLGLVPTGTAILNANQPVFFRFWNPTTKLLGATAITQVTTSSAGSTYDVGVYSVSGSALTRQWHTGSISGGATGQKVTTGITTYTMAGGQNYYLAYCASNTIVVIAPLFSGANQFILLGGSSGTGVANTIGNDSSDTCNVVGAVLPSTATSTNIVNSSSPVEIPAVVVVD